MNMILKTNIIIFIPNSRTTIACTTFTNKQIAFCSRAVFDFFLCKIHHFYIIKDKISPIEIGGSNKLLWCSSILVATTLLFATCMIEYVTYPCPFPRRRYLKRDLLINALHLSGGEKLLIIGIIVTTVNDRFVFVFFDFLFLDQSGFFSSDTFKKYRCRFVIRVLRYKFSLYRPLEYAVF